MDFRTVLANLPEVKVTPYPSGRAALVMFHVVSQPGTWSYSFSFRPQRSGIPTTTYKSRKDTNMANVYSLYLGNNYEVDEFVVSKDSWQLVARGAFATPLLVSYMWCVQ